MTRDDQCAERVIGAPVPARGPNSASGKPRLQVTAALARSGGGMVVMGFLNGGRLSLDQEVLVQPTRTRARILRLRVRGIETGVAMPDCWVVAQLTELTSASRQWTSTVVRGEVVTVEGLGDATDTVDVLLERSGWLFPVGGRALLQLRDRCRLRVLAGTSDVAATVFLHGKGLLADDRGRLAQLRFEAPVFLFANDWLVLCDPTGHGLLGTARVLDPEGDRKHWQHKAQRGLLEARATAPPGSEGALVWVQSALTRHGLLDREAVLAASSFDSEAIRAALEQLAHEGRAVLTSKLAADGLTWRDLIGRATAAIDRAHQAHPERLGLPVKELRAQLGDAVAASGAFEAVLAALGEIGYIQDARCVRRAAHRPALPSRLEVAGAWLRQALAEKPFEPPSRKDLTPNADAARALQFLIETGEVVELGPAQVLGARAYAQAVERIVQCLRERGQATLSELRHCLGSSRRIVIPLCEKLDLEGITQRDGDVRRLGLTESP